MATCEYSTVCDEADSNGENVYKCIRDAAAGRAYCELHDESYLDGGDAGAVTRALMEEAAGSRRLVGFHLPAISSADVTGGPMYFEQCRFHGMVDFSGLHAGASIAFVKCAFAGGANFAGGTFDSVVRFKSIESGPRARFDFSRSKFAEIHVIGSRLPQVDFLFVEFSRGRFIDDVFTGRFSLSDARLNDCSFIDVTFEKKAGFTASKFARCVFRNLSFAAAAFTSSIFDSKEMSVMDTDMTNVSLLDADLSGVKFTDRTKWDENYGHEIYDARMFYSDPGPDRFAATLRVLRALRDNYDYHLMYRDAGQFFVQEMELRRRYSLRGDRLVRHPVCRRIFSLTGLYFWICGYGESLKRAGAWLVLLFGASLGYFALAGEAFPNADLMPASSDIFERVSLYLKQTLAAFFPLGGGDLPDYVVRVTSIPLLGTLFIVIRRRLERKLRH